MRRKLFGVLAVAALVAVALPAKAQTLEVPSSDAGIAPGSFWYGLDTFEEDFHDAVMLRKSSKARLGLDHAEERLAEIQKLIAEKGNDPEGLSTALERLRENIQRTTATVSDIQDDGEDAGDLADELTSILDDQERILEGILDNQRDFYGTDIDEILKKIQDAAGDVEKLQELRDELNAKIVELKNVQDEMESTLDDMSQHNDAIEDAMHDQAKAAKAMAKAREKLTKIQDQLTSDGLVIPADVLASYTDLMNQAETAYVAGNYAEARKLAKQAKHTLSLYEDSLDNEQEDEIENEVHDEINGSDDNDSTDAEDEQKGDDEQEDENDDKDEDKHSDREDRSTSGSGHEDTSSDDENDDRMDDSEDEPDAVNDDDEDSHDQDNEDENDEGEDDGDSDHSGSGSGDDEDTEVDHDVED